MSWLFSVFRITDDGVMFGVDSLNKKIYHQPQVSWVSYIHFSVPLTISQRDEMMQLWIPSESKRQEKLSIFTFPGRLFLLSFCIISILAVKLASQLRFHQFFWFTHGIKRGNYRFSNSRLFASFRSLMSHGGIHAGYVGESDENSSDVKLVEPSFRCRRNSLLTSKGRCVSLGLFFLGIPPKKSLPKLNFLHKGVSNAS